MIRVRHGIRNGPSATGGRERERPRRHPVLLVPPLLETSAVYFINFPVGEPRRVAVTPQISELRLLNTRVGRKKEKERKEKKRKGFLFADSGYDVWAMSNRESSHISNSTRYSQRDPRHWKWSFDELGRYDLAACIDHVLKVTGAPKLTTVALSQGVIANLVLHSVRPEYNNKRLVYPFTMAGFLGTSRGLRSLISGVCTLWGGTLCALGFTMTSFCSPEQFNTEVFSAKLRALKCSLVSQDICKLMSRAIFQSS
ncbi:hypothetical protein HPB51_024045 [Rhipicephalus microplus]|uniref:Uncharacterized protein n=1 Tax=Rhipicephalus microplus TaxID=6941 RepID=A0A9J6ED44_RHIMP|nr:hypothetical protein HPB51_024045 [Rhipicephalus microplus]